MAQLQGPRISNDQLKEFMRLHNAQYGAQAQSSAYQAVISQQQSINPQMYTTGYGTVTLGGSAGQTITNNGAGWTATTVNFGEDYANEKPVMRKRMSKSEMTGRVTSLLETIKLARA